MKAGILQRLVKKAPFEPFTISFRNGERLDVRHPEVLWISNAICVLRDPADEEGTSWQIFFPIEIVSIEPARRNRRARAKRP
ncbi:MAG: hypothetical protein HY720_15310 [Planctomycetes bacterium]|nr:hypothetical protein [Planctomycetota bacterium]